MLFYRVKKLFVAKNTSTCNREVLEYLGKEILHLFGIPFNYILSLDGHNGNQQRLIIPEHRTPRKNDDSDSTYHQVYNVASLSLAHEPKFVISEED